MKTNDKIELIKMALEQRVHILEEAISQFPNHPEVLWRKGKRDGYYDALDLLSESNESISVEL